MSWELPFAYAQKVFSQGNPSPSPSVFRYLFVYSSFALAVNNTDVMVCCCHTGLNLHVLDDKDPKTKMLIAPTNQHSCSSAQADATAGISTAMLLHSSASSTIHRSPRQVLVTAVFIPSIPLAQNFNIHVGR